MKTALLAIALMQASLIENQGKMSNVHVEGTKIVGSQVTDVPAIQVKRVIHHKEDSWGCADLMACVATEDEYGDFWTCADKSRVLLTSEGGTRHCVKF